MIAYGRTDKHFFCFTPDATTNGYLIREIRLAKKFINEREQWVIDEERWVWNAVHNIGFLRVDLKKPLTIIDFSSNPHEPRIFGELSKGVHEFQLLSIELPIGTPNRFVEIAVIPGSIMGVMFEGLVKAAYDHTPYWKRRGQLDVLHVLETYLVKRLVIDHVVEMGRPAPEGILRCVPVNQT